MKTMGDMTLRPKRAPKPFTAEEDRALRAALGCGIKWLRRIRDRQSGDPREMARDALQDIAEALE
jgi:hypothetical protein